MNRNPTPASPPLTPAERARLRVIQETLRTGDTALAGSMADQALAEGLRHPFAYNVSAMKLEADGRLEAAAEQLRRGLELAPEDVGCLHALGLCLLRLELPEEARPLLERVTELHADFAPAHVALGQALEASGLMRPAESRYRRALELQPENIMAEAGLASVLGRRGEHAEARQRAERMLAREPNYPPAAMVIAESDVAEREGARAESRMRALLEDPRLSPVECSLATSILGDALDVQGREGDAFAAYSESNEIRRRHYATAFPSRTGTLEYARAVRDWFRRHPARDILTAVPPEPSRSPAIGHAFLLGFPRSGTTLLEQVLASHPAVVALEERDTLIDSVRAFMRTPAEFARLGLAPDAALEDYRAAYWQRVSEAGVLVEHKVFIDKHPLNGLKLPLIVRLFPEARVLLAVRDPRDVVWSCFRRRFRMNAPYYELLTLEGAAALYDVVMEVTELFIRELEIPTHIVRLERVIADFDREVRDVCRFLDIAFVDGMREFAQSARTRGVATASSAQVVRELNAGGVGEWRRYRKELAPILPVLERWVRHFGYESD